MALQTKMAVEHRRVRGWDMTLITNMGEFANALGRPGFLLTVFIKVDFGHDCYFDETTGVGSLYGFHDAAELSAIFEKGFNKKFIQCYGCGSSATEMMVTDSQVGNKCGACGFISEFPLMDNLREYVRFKFLDQVPEERWLSESSTHFPEERFAI